MNLDRSRSYAPLRVAAGALILLGLLIASMTILEAWCQCIAAFMSS